MCCLNRMYLNLRQKLEKCYIWNIAFFGADIWTHRKVDRNTSKVLNCGAGKG